ncbi:MAG: cytochrome b [Roseovarius sp.]
MPLKDTSCRYGTVSRALHWGMAALFAAQFLSAAAHWSLPRENAVRETLWSYHGTLFVLVLLRGTWGLANMPRRPPAHQGIIGRAAVAGHLAIYALMVIVPAVRFVAAAGSDRGLTYLGITLLAPREVEIAWMQAPAEWHGEMGWILGVLVLGQIAMAVIWHRMIRRDGTMQRMAG